MSPFRFEFRTLRCLCLWLIWVALTPSGAWGQDGADSSDPDSAPPEAVVGADVDSEEAIDDGSDPSEEALAELDLSARSRIELEIPEVGLRDAWVEVTSLRDDRSQLHWLGDLAFGEETAIREVEPKEVTGPAIVCVGSSGLASQCERRYLYGDLDASAEGVTSVSLRRDVDEGDRILPWTIDPGLPWRGSVQQDGFPVPGTTLSLVAVGPAGERPVVMPLGVDPSTFIVERSVITDDQGVFHGPPVAPGDYILEAHLPTGQLHRVGPISLPAPPEGATRVAATGGETTQTEDASPAGNTAPTTDTASALEPFDFGEIAVPSGLSMEVQVLDPDGSPLADARVSARQDEGPGRLRELEASTDETGSAYLIGLTAESPLELRCRAAGFTPVETTYELLPVVAVCEPAALAEVLGSVSAADAAEDRRLQEAGGSPEEPALALITASMEPVDPELGSRSILADAEGRFALSGLAPGPWSLTLAAPGFEPWSQELILEPGQSLDLGAVYLPASRSLSGRVVAVEDGRPIAGASIRALDPLGVAQTLSDGDGRFVVSAVDDRPLVLEIGAGDRPRKRVVWDSQTQSLPERTVELERGGFLRVEMVGADGGDPCVGCVVRLVPSESIQATLGDAMIELETDGYGEVLSEALAPGGYFVQRPRYEVLGSTISETPDAERKFTTVRADEITTLRFTEGGPEIRIRLRPVGRVGARSHLSVRTALRYQKAPHEGDGVFTARTDEGVSELFLHRWNPQTQYEDRIYLGPLTPISGPATGSGAALGLDAERAQAPAEAVSFRMSESRIHGRLQTFAETAVAGARIRLRSLADGRFLSEVRSDESGHFQIDDMAPGVYSLLIGERAFQFVSVLAERSVDLGTFQWVPGSY